MSLRFNLLDWQAFAPGLHDKPAWQAWAGQPHAPRGTEAPALVEMSAMQRRRVEQLGRMALQVAYWCRQGEDAGLPLVFASRHGDLSRTYDMLRALARDEALSPTSFGLSTHNAIAAQYGIARQHTGQCQVVSAGAMTAEAAFIEAIGLLADGAGEVLVVVYDRAVPEAYRGFADETDADFAWAARLGQGTAFSLAPVAGAGVPERGDDLPHGLQVLRFLIGSASSLEAGDDLGHWSWQRHA